MRRPWRQENPRITPDEVRFQEFSGLVNTRSRKDVGLSALVTADNVCISDTKKIVRRDGYSVVRSGNVRSAFSAGGNFYVVDGASLYLMASTAEFRLLANDVAEGECVWAESNGAAYLTVGAYAVICTGETVTPWRLTVPAITSAEAVQGSITPGAMNVGATYTQATFRVCATYETADGRETAPSLEVTVAASPGTNLVRVSVPPLYANTCVYTTAADGAVFGLAARGTSGVFTFNPQRTGRELGAYGLSSVPDDVTHSAFLGSRAVVGAYLPESKISVVWLSQPFAPHLWNLASDFILVPGQLGLLLGNNEGLLIGTTERIHQYTEEGELKQLAAYGVVPGSGGDVDAGEMAYFWTQRGVCRASPFENLTEKDVSMEPGARAVGRVIYHEGQEQFLVVTQDAGDVFNLRTERSTT